MLYGLLIAGGLFAYFDWKKNNSGSNSSETESTSTSGTFVDDVPVSQEVAEELLEGNIKIPTFQSIKESKIVEPLIGKKQVVLGQDEIFEA